MSRPFRPRRPEPPATSAGYSLEPGDDDAVRAAKVLVTARRQGRARDEEERARVEGQQRMASILERARERAAQAPGGAAYRPGSSGPFNGR